MPEVRTGLAGAQVAHHYRARTYFAETARFGQADRFSLITRNYPYVDNNPLSGTDPKGQYIVLNRDPSEVTTDSGLQEYLARLGYYLGHELNIDRNGHVTLGSKLPSEKYGFDTDLDWWKSDEAATYAVSVWGFIKYFSVDSPPHKKQWDKMIEEKHPTASMALEIVKGFGGGAAAGLYGWSTAGSRAIEYATGIEFVPKFDPYYEKYGQVTNYVTTGVVLLVLASELGVGIGLGYIEEGAGADGQLDPLNQCIAEANAMYWAGAWGDPTSQVAEDMRQAYIDDCFKRYPLTPGE